MASVGLVAPTIYPVSPEGYGGIERLVGLFARGLKEAHPDGTVTCFCPEGSHLPRGVIRVSTGPCSVLDFSEPNLYPTIANHRGRNTYCWLDFSHSRPVGKLPDPPPAIFPIWHDPRMMKCYIPNYNVAALSQWQAQRFMEVYKQVCIVLDPICVDSQVFKPGKPDLDIEDYCIFLGNLSRDKGALQAIEACKAIKQRLVVVGAVTPDNPPDYVAAVQSACDGQDIIYYPEVSESHKLALYQGAKAMLYPVSYPPGLGESHSHKSAECMMTGTPVIAYDQGAMNEVIEDGVTGFVISPGRERIAKAIQDCEGIDRARCSWVATTRWDYRIVIPHWYHYIANVVGGMRW